MTPICPARSGFSDDVWDGISREPAGGTLLEVVSGPAARYPTAPALFISPDGRTAEPLSWNALWEGVQAQAESLRQNGVDAGEPVILAAPTSTTFFTAFFGILAAGGVPVPIATPPSLNPTRCGWYADLLSRIADDAAARQVLTTSRYLATIEGCAAASAAALRVSAADAIQPSAQTGDAHRPAPNDVALLQYTSGSTSRPKGVALTHANILANARAIAETIVHRDSCCVSWLPLYHDMGLIGAALTGLFSRTPLLFLPTTVFIKEPAAWLCAISAFGATITLAPNFAFAHAARHVSIEQLEGVSLATLRTALNGAEPVDVAAVDAFEEKFAAVGLRQGVVRPVYGLAESALAVTFADEAVRDVDVVCAEALEREAIARPATRDTRTRRFVSVGRPLPSQEIRIADEQGAPLPERHVGEVVVRGPSVMIGYYRHEKETRAALRGGWLRTGDLGYVADGRLYLTGRLKDLIIRYGRNYSPTDIELAVAGAEGVLRGGSAAFSLESGGETRVIVIAETRLRRAADLADLVRQIRERCVSAFLFGPDDVRLVPGGAIPRTTSGKVRRHACRDLYTSAALPDIGTDPPPPAHPSA